MCGLAGVVLLGSEHPLGKSLVPLYFGGIFLLSLVSNLGQTQRT